jgi:hypothetical protein
MSRVSIKSGAYLDQILAFGLCDERLKFGCRESVNQTGLGNDEEENLSASQDGQFVCLNEWVSEVPSNPDVRDDAFNLGGCDRPSS